MTGITNFGTILGHNCKYKENSAMRNEKGFTLIEVMLVVGVIGIIASIAIPRLSPSKAAAGDATAKSDLKSAITALVRHSVTNSTFPATSAELESSGYSLSPRVSWNRYDLENGSVHMHVQHTYSDDEWHANYPGEGAEIEIVGAPVAAPTSPPTAPEDPEEEEDCT